MGVTRKWSPEVTVAYKKPHCSGWGRWAVTCLGWGLGAMGTPQDPGLCQTLILKPGLAGKSLLWVGINGSVHWWRSNLEFDPPKCMNLTNFPKSEEQGTFTIYSFTNLLF